MNSNSQSLFGINAGEGVGTYFGGFTAIPSGPSEEIIVRIFDGKELVQFPRFVDKFENGRLIPSLNQAVIYVLNLIDEIKEGMPPKDKKNIVKQIKEMERNNTGGTIVYSNLTITIDKDSLEDPDKTELNTFIKDEFTKYVPSINLNYATEFDLTSKEIRSVSEILYSIRGSNNGTFTIKKRKR